MRREAIRLSTAKPLGLRREAILLSTAKVLQPNPAPRSRGGYRLVRAVPAENATCFADYRGGLRRISLGSSAPGGKRDVDHSISLITAFTADIAWFEHSRRETRHGSFYFADYRLVCGGKSSDSVPLNLVVGLTLASSLALSLFPFKADPAARSVALEALPAQLVS